MKIVVKFMLYVLCGFCSIAMAKTVVIQMYLTGETTQGKHIGTITAKDSAHGLLLIPNLKNLSPGLHGMHIHQLMNCLNYGKNAGSHLDPKKSGNHLGPFNTKGHLGDLPNLYVNKEGHAIRHVLAPRLTVSKIKNHSLIIHTNEDNYSDIPKKLGGSGTRTACGVIK